VRLRRNELCPIHRLLSGCGREPLQNERITIRIGVQRIEVMGGGACSFLFSSFRALCCASRRSKGDSTDRSASASSTWDLQVGKYLNFLCFIAWFHFIADKSTYELAARLSNSARLLISVAAASPTTQ
jgi:hypothetical protein